MSDTSIRVSHETLLRLDEAKEDIAKRGYVLRSNEDAINALLDLFKHDLTAI